MKKGHRSQKFEDLKKREDHKLLADFLNSKRIKVSDLVKRVKSQSKNGRKMLNKSQAQLVKSPLSFKDKCNMKIQQYSQMDLNSSNSTNLYLESKDTMFIDQNKKILNPIKLRLLRNILSIRRNKQNENRMFNSSFNSRRTSLVEKNVTNSFPHLQDLVDLKGVELTKILVPRSIKNHNIRIDDSYISSKLPENFSLKMPNFNKLTKQNLFGEIKDSSGKSFSKVGSTSPQMHTSHRIPITNKIGYLSPIRAIDEESADFNSFTRFKSKFTPMNRSFKFKIDITDSEEKLVK
jgi:hypothetical protein